MAWDCFSGWPWNLACVCIRVTNVWACKPKPKSFTRIWILNCPYIWSNSQYLFLIFSYAESLSWYCNSHQECEHFWLILLKDASFYVRNRLKFGKMSGKDIAIVYENVKKHWISKIWSYGHFKLLKLYFEKHFSL